MRAWRVAALALAPLSGAALLWAVGASGQPPAPAMPPHGADAGVQPGDQVWSSCVEYLPEGAVRPKLQTKLPARGMSGYAVRLEVTVSHGAGETVMPEGFQLQRGSDAILALEKSGWVIPEADGGAAPEVKRSEAAADGVATVTTEVTVPFVPLPKEPGRHLMTLPPMPISVARANGQVMTLCSEARTITIDDPIANEIDPQVKPNPLPRPQREDWAAARQVTYGGLAVVALALLLAWLLHRWRQRPKIEPPKVRVLPWIAAMRELEEIRGSGLLDDGKLDEFFDRVDNCTRFYLGDRYGFDGLESTSEEIRGYLGRVYPPIPQMEQVYRFLEDSDFVKYAEVDPRREDCDEALERAQDIIRFTTPPSAVSLDPKRRPPQRKKRKKRKRKAA